MELAADEGMTVEQRPVHVDEIGTFSEVAACGTAVVITPVNKVLYKDQLIMIGEQNDRIGDVMNKLYKRVRAIQCGEEKDKFGWTVPI